MPTYKSRKNEIIDETGKQIAIVMPVNCTKKEACIMAAYAAGGMQQKEVIKALYIEK